MSRNPLKSQALAHFKSLDRARDKVLVTSSLGKRKAGEGGDGAGGGTGAGGKVARVSSQRQLRPPPGGWMQSKQPVGQRLKRVMDVLQGEGASFTPRELQALMSGGGGKDYKANDVSLEQDEEVLLVMRRHEMVQFDDVSGRYSYRSSHVARSKDELRMLVSKAMEGMTRDELADSYPGAAADLDQLIEDGFLYEFRNASTGAAILHYRDPQHNVGRLKLMGRLYCDKCESLKFDAGRRFERMDKDRRTKKGELMRCLGCGRKRHWNCAIQVLEGGDAGGGTKKDAGAEANAGSGAGGGTRAGTPQIDPLAWCCSEECELTERTKSTWRSVNIPRDANAWEPIELQNELTRCGIMRCFVREAAIKANEERAKLKKEAAKAAKKRGGTMRKLINSHLADEIDMKAVGRHSEGGLGGGT